MLPNFSTTVNRNKVEYLLAAMQQESFQVIGLPKLPVAKALEWGREMKKRSPQADTLLFPCPHWAVVEAIDPLEQELGVTVVTNLQATLWHALRSLGLNDKISGYGRLLREL